jgi:hypothetical protein
MAAQHLFALVGDQRRAARERDLAGRADGVDPEDEEPASQAVAASTAVTSGT